MGEDKFRIVNAGFLFVRAAPGLKAGKVGTDDKTDIFFSYPCLSVFICGLYFSLETKKAALRRTAFFVSMLFSLQLRDAIHRLEHVRSAVERADADEPFAASSETFARRTHDVRFLEHAVEEVP